MGKTATAAAGTGMFLHSLTDCMQVTKRDHRIALHATGRRASPRFFFCLHFFWHEETRPSPAACGTNNRRYMLEYMLQFELQQETLYLAYVCQNSAKADFPIS